MRGVWRSIRTGRLGASTPLLAANLLEALLPFARNVVLARLIAPDAFGLAISLSVVIGMIEVLTDFGLPVFAVRRDDRMPHATMMGTLQSMALLRAALLGLLLAIVSPWVAAAFHAGDDSWPYSVLGAIVFLRGFENFGVKAMMRDYAYWAEALVVVCAQAAGFAATIAAAASFGTFSCMVWGMLATTCVTILLSHALSPEAYRLHWNRSAVRQMTHFGRPLLINGMAVSLTLADRLLIGSLLGPRQLAVYNVAYGTAQLPRTVLAKFLTSAFLPLFVQHRERGEVCTRLFDSWAWCLSCLAFAYGFALSLIGDQALAIVFGEAYRPSRLFMCLAGLSVCVKLLMLLPVPAAYAAGNTRLVAVGSILSALSVLPGAALLLWRYDLTAFLAGMTAAEFLALIAFGRHAMRGQTFQTGAAWSSIGAPVLLLALLTGLTSLAPAITLGGWIAAGGLTLAASMMVYGLMIARFDIGLRELLRS